MLLLLSLNGRATILLADAVTPEVWPAGSPALSEPKGRGRGDMLTSCCAPQDSDPTIHTASPPRAKHDPVEEVDLSVRTTTTECSQGQGGGDVGAVLERHMLTTCSHHAPKRGLPLLIRGKTPIYLCRVEVNPILPNTTSAESR